MSSSVLPAPSGTADAGTVRTCGTCEVVLHQVDGFDADVALGTFLLHHPDAAQAVHRAELPAGWRQA
jgi:hypothetical protein